MSTTTKVSPRIRDRVPEGFYVDVNTWDVGLMQELEQFQEALQESYDCHPLRVAEDAVQVVASPHCKGKHSGRPMRILLVEDNPGDVRLIQEALQESKLSNQLIVAENGVEALAILRRRGNHAAAPRPNLILLDLNLPLKDGREVLQEIKKDADLRRIPVVVLTTSQAEDDILKTYDLHANCYIKKRLDLEHFITVVQLLQAFWFHIVQLPSQ